MHVHHPKSRKISLADLIADPSFRNWVGGIDPESVRNWDAYLQQNSHQQSVLAEAAFMVRGISFAPKRLPPQVVEQQWQKLQQRLQEPAPTRYVKPVSVLLNDYQYVALTFFSILVGAVGYWYFRVK